jgi:hypothetical protein
VSHAKRIERRVSDRRRRVAGRAGRAAVQVCWAPAKRWATAAKARPRWETVPVGHTTARVAVGDEVTVGARPASVSRYQGCTTGTPRRSVADGAQDRAPALEAAPRAGRDRRPRWVRALDRAPGAGAVRDQPPRPRRPGHGGAGALLRTPHPRGPATRRREKSLGNIPDGGSWR